MRLIRVFTHAAQAIGMLAAMSIHLNDAINHKGSIYDTNFLSYHTETSRSFVFCVISVTLMQPLHVKRKVNDCLMEFGHHSLFSRLNVINCLNEISQLFTYFVTKRNCIFVSGP